MVAALVKRPVGLPVQRIPEREIGVQSRAVGADIIRHEREGVLAVVEVTDLQVTVDLIERLEAHGYVLDLGSAESLNADGSRSRLQCLAHDGEYRAAAEQLRPLELEHDREDVGSVERI